ncbi:hypothetical protein NL108_013355 [Boleophthalmus pectinirostris]|nr:hypothetical protein NL108_013355 [Boleophthalmus pectinirostris]
MFYKSFHIFPIDSSYGLTPLKIRLFPAYVSSNPRRLRGSNHARSDGQVHRQPKPVPNSCFSPSLNSLFAVTSHRLITHGLSG